MFAIKIAYSNGDQESISMLFDTAEKAFHHACHMAAEEAYQQNTEFEDDATCTIMIDAGSYSIDLVILCIRCSAAGAITASFSSLIMSPWTLLRSFRTIHSMLMVSFPSRAATAPRRPCLAVAALSIALYSPFLRDLSKWRKQKKVHSCIRTSMAGNVR